MQYIQKHDEFRWVGWGGGENVGREDRRTQVLSFCDVTKRQGHGSSHLLSEAGGQWVPKSFLSLVPAFLLQLLVYTGFLTLLETALSHFCPQPLSEHGCHLPPHPTYRQVRQSLANYLMPQQNLKVPCSSKTAFLPGWVLQLVRASSPYTKVVGSISGHRTYKKQPMTG